MESKQYNCAHCGELFWSKNPKVKYKRGHFWMGRHHSQEAKDKLSKSHTGHKWTEEQKENLSKIRLEKWKDPEYREKTIEARKVGMQDPEYKALQSKISKKRWEDPEYKEKHSKSLKEYWEKPESHEKRSELSTKFWESPIRRQEHSEKMSKFWENDEERLRQSEVMKQNWVNGDLNVEQTKKSSYGRSGYYKGIYMRSQVEIRCAEKLDSAGILWDYEPKRFYLEELDCTYCPDFYLPEFDMYLEVKYAISGYERVVALMKIDGLRNMGERIIMVQNKDLKCV